MPEDDHKNLRKIQCWIPVSTWDKVKERGYPNFSKAVNEALDLLLEVPREIPQDVTPGNSEFPNSLEKFPNSPEKFPDSSEKFPDLKALTEEQKAKIEDYKAQVQTLNAEITRLKTTIMEAPDPVELVKNQERNEGLLRLIEEKERLIEEKEKRIEDLTREVTTLNGFAHYFKTAEVKQIEAPVAERKKPWWKLW
jgi:hypothetical protein